MLPSVDTVPQVFWLSIKEIFQMVQLVLFENVLDLNQVRDFCWKTSTGKVLANAVVRTWEYCHTSRVKVAALCQILLSFLFLPI